MPFKKIVRELRGRNKAIGSRRGRSHIAPEGSSSSSSPSSPSPSTDECSEQSIWVDLPPELLLDIIHRIESGQTLWPGRRDVVACASVCRSWRDMTKDEVVQVPELSGLLTFPLSLKQFRHPKATPSVYSERSSSNRKLPPSMRVSPWVSSSTHSYNMASILYELNVLRTRGPRRMQCIMNSIPVSSIQEGGQVHSPTEFTNQGNKKNKKSMMDLCTGNMGGESVVKEPLVLKNKSPRWHEQLQCWCLNFKGRVTVASVKNFQLIAAAAEAGKNMNIPEEEQERVILQFGKIGKDIFTMDYRYPISAFQAFAICLSSFDTKPVCE